jgi:hypothetical protein
VTWPGSYRLTVLTSHIRPTAASFPASPPAAAHHALTFLDRKLTGSDLVGGYVGAYVGGVMVLTAAFAPGGPAQWSTPGVH